jgi:hypothetical protein
MNTFFVNRHPPETSNIFFPYSSEIENDRQFNYEISSLSYISLRINKTKHPYLFALEHRTFETRYAIHMIVNFTSSLM